MMEHGRGKGTGRREVGAAGEKEVAEGYRVMKKAQPSWHYPHTAAHQAHGLSMARRWLVGTKSIGRRNGRDWQVELVAKMVSVDIKEHRAAKPLLASPARICSCQQEASRVSR